MSNVYGGNSAEHLYGTDGGDGMFGNGGDDTLEGFNGNDVMSGGAGDDWLYGQGGDDWMLGAGPGGEGAGDDVIDGGAGYDTVTYADADYRVYVNLDKEQAWSFGSDVGDDKLYSIENIVGGAGDDVLQGSYWTIFSGHGENRINGGDGNDHIEGFSGNDTLIGGQGNDIIYGGDDQDVINGGSGSDDLYGGYGSDIFVFGGTLSNPDTGLGNQADMIYDFEHGIDKIDLSQIDANVNIAGNQQFAFIGSGAFTAPGQVSFGNVGNSYVLHLNVDGDSASEYDIQFWGHPTLSGSDFIL